YPMQARAGPSRSTPRRTTSSRTSTSSRPRRSTATPSWSCSTPFNPSRIRRTDASSSGLCARFDDPAVQLPDTLHLVAGGACSSSLPALRRREAHLCHSSVAQGRARPPEQIDHGEMILARLGDEATVEAGVHPGSPELGRLPNELARIPLGPRDNQGASGFGDVSHRAVSMRAVSIQTEPVIDVTEAYR